MFKVNQVFDKIGVTKSTTVTIECVQDQRVLFIFNVGELLCRLLFFHAFSCCCSFPLWFFLYWKSKETQYTRQKLWKKQYFSNIDEESISTISQISSATTPNNLLFIFTCCELPVCARSVAFSIPVLIRVPS